MSQSLSSEGELFRKIMGESWSGLHPDIQRRFEKNPPAHAPLKYTGVLEDLWCSAWGKILATLSFPLVGGALIPWRAKDFPVDIRVYSEQDKPGLLFKHRTYRLPGRKPVEFLSYMKESPRGEVLEYVGGGLGMKLKVFEKDGNLHFQSDGYFWDTGWFRIPLPGIFTPGDTYLTHVNEAENRFRISIVITHRLFGKMFTQAGVFYEVRDHSR